ncbi:hypothetical protein BGZ63DRAFT_91890 [Mariannaea sp. PMI_226]|nr:hypothetical protein BGZ63DRAFT_91890 [Mariannaea sp. PMI_226]
MITWHILSYEFGVCYGHQIIPSQKPSLASRGHEVMVVIRHENVETVLFEAGPPHPSINPSTHECILSLPFSLSILGLTRLLSPGRPMHAELIKQEISAPVSFTPGLSPSFLGVGASRSFCADTWNSMPGRYYFKNDFNPLPQSNLNKPPL